MAEFLMICVFAIAGVIMAAPVTAPLLIVAVLLAWRGRNVESTDRLETRRFRRWCFVQAIPSLLIVLGGAIAGSNRGQMEDELAVWLLVLLLSQLFLMAIGCWWCQARWRSTLAAALGLGVYSLGASIASIYASISRL